MEAAVISIIVSAAITLISLWAGRGLQRAQAKKTLAEAGSDEATAVKTITDTSLLLVAEMRKAKEEMRKEFDEEMGGMKKELKAVRRELDYYRKGVGKLVNQLIRAGMNPDFVPDVNKVFDVPE